MTTPIGSASITVQAVTDAFQNTLTRDTDRVLDSLERNFDRTWDNLRHTVDNNTDLMVVTFNQAAADIQQTMRDTAQSIERSFDRAADRSADRLEAAFSQAARDMAASFERASEQSADRVDNALTQIRLEMERTTAAIQEDADEAGDAIGNEITEGVAQANLSLALLRDGADRALSSVGGLAGSLTNAGGRGASALTTLGTAAVATSLSIAAFTQAAAGAVAVVEQLVGVALVAPAAILSFAAVTKTLNVALNGFSEAISAALADDTVAFVKAMDKLEPTAQGVVTALSGVISGFQNLGKVIQGNFFQDLGEPLRLFGEAAEQVARDNLPRLSTVMGRIAASFLETVTKSNLLPGINAVLDRTVDGVAGLEGPLTRLAPAFGTLFGVGAGFIDRMYASLGNLIDRFSVFIQKNAETGQLTIWIEEAIDGFKQLGRILGNIGSIFSTLNTAAGEAGTGILEILERVTQAIDEALNSDVGQAFLTASFGLLAQVMESLAIVMGPLVELFAVFATGVATRLTSALEAAEPFLRSVGTAISDLSGELPGLNSRLGDVARDGFGFLSEVAGDLFEALSPVVPLFEEFLSNVSAMSGGFDGAFLDDLVDGVGELGVGLAAGVLDALDSLIGALLELGRLLPRILPLVGELAEAIGLVLGDAIDATIPLFEPLVDMLEDLSPAVDLVSNALSGMAQITGGLLLALSPLLKAITSFAGLVSESLNPAVTALRTTFAEIQPGLERVGELLGGTLSRALAGLQPGLDAIVKGFIDLLPTLKEFGPPLEQIITAMASLIEIVGVLAGELLAKLIPAMFRMIQAGIEFDLLIVKTLAPVIENLARILAEELGPAFDEVLPVAVGAFEGIATGVEKAYEIIGPILATFVDVLAVVLPAAFESAKTAIKIAWDAIVLIVETAWDIISGVFNIITNVLEGDFAGAWRALENLVVDVFEGIWEFIVNTVNNIIDFFTSDAVGRLATAVGGMFGAAWTKVAGWMSSIWNSVTGVIEDVIQWFKDLPGRILDTAANANQWLFDIGKDIVNGLIEGLKDAAGGLKDVVVDNIIDPVKGFFSNAFDFGSPSKVTKRWGGWIGEGFAIGMRDAESQVVAAAEAITMAAAMPGITLTGGTAGSPNTMAPFAPVTSGGLSAPASGAVFGPGAIQVVFSGVVPSESQAYATGQAVGSGIADELARRDARIAVGTL